MPKTRHDTRRLLHSGAVACGAFAVLLLGAGACNGGESPEPATTTRAPATPTAEATTPSGAPTPTAVEATPTATPTASARTYEVMRGDTLSGIAQEFGVTVRALVEANNIDDPDQIFPGDKLTIPRR